MEDSARVLERQVGLKLKFPETINLSPSDANVVSSSTTTPVGIVSPISQIDMDFDTLDTTFDLNNNDFDKLFDLGQEVSSNVDDDSASEPSVDDFLKLIAQLDDNMSAYPMALAA